MTRRMMLAVTSTAGVPCDLQERMQAYVQAKGTPYFSWCMFKYLGHMNEQDFSKIKFLVRDGIITLKTYTSTDVHCSAIHKFSYLELAAWYQQGCPGFNE
jgi:hypothetical protein